MLKLIIGFMPALSFLLLLSLPQTTLADAASSQWYQIKNKDDVAQYPGIINTLITAQDRKNALKLDYDPYTHEQKQLSKEEALKRLNKFASTALFDRLQNEWELLSYRWSANKNTKGTIDAGALENFQTSEGLEWTPDISYRVRSRYLEMVTHFNYTKLRLQAHYQGTGVIQWEQRIPESTTQFGASFNQQKEHVEFSLTRPLAEGVTGKLSQQHGDQQNDWYQVAELMFNHTF